MAEQAGVDPAAQAVAAAGSPLEHVEVAGRHLLRRMWPLIRFILGLGAGALVVWVLSSHTDELSGLSSVFGHLTWAWLIPAIVVEAASYGSLALVQRRLLATGGLVAPLSTLSVLTLASQAIINSVPGGSAAATVYGFRWFRRLGASDSLAVWSLAATVVVGVISLALVAAAGLGIATSYGASLDLVPVIIGVLAVTVALGALFLYHRPQRAVAGWLLRMSRRVTRRDFARAEARVASFLAQLAEFRPSRGEIVSLLGWGVANWVFDCACFAFSFLAVGAGIPWKGLLLSYGAGQLAANLPITPGGLGVVEGSITIALVAFGGPRLSTVEAVLIYRLISFWGQLVVGWAGAGWLALGVRSGRWRRQTRPQRV
ncbi:MAG TPA: lysylphosphatidylglycerol synthase transmembrane domain-containing protein, partial [Acidimicrobiales bacterium]|nr:lysylphosphatidylglycerol synthase transmembrane domain-containing protein [Acidimicrobiales bacterium]